jgi:hypothetical protein
VTLKNPLIAFVGYARTGKDEAAKTLIAAGYSRVCFGDIIKMQLDEVIQKHLKFSAFTEISEEKAKIRRTLENWGEDNYDNIFAHFFNTLPTPSVNTRLCRVREGKEWVARGGTIVEVTRPGVGPETDWSRDRLEELRAEGLIARRIINIGTPADLAETVRRVLL